MESLQLGLDRFGELRLNSPAMTLVADAHKGLSALFASQRELQKMATASIAASPN